MHFQEDGFMTTDSFLKFALTQDLEEYAICFWVRMNFARSVDMTIVSAASQTQDNMLNIGKP